MNIRAFQMVEDSLEKLPPDWVIRETDLLACGLYRKSPAQLRYDIGRGYFPKSVALTPKIVGFRVSDLRAHLSAAEA